jgi:hypothetical protein
LRISQQLHNVSTTPYNHTSTEPPRWAVRVNCYLYVSLALTLSSAFVSVLALQWIRNYDLDTSNRANPRERALYRHFRFQGLKNWRLSQIISTLPGLIHVALLLFFLGLIEWLFQTNKVVAFAMLSAVGSVVLFYMITQGAAVANVSAPFRTPISHIIERIRVLFINYVTSKVVNRPVASPRSLKSYRSREEQFMISDRLLPFSALIWLFNRQLTSQWSSTALFDILEQLTEMGDLSLKQKAFTGSSIQWSTVFDKLSVDLYRLRLADKTYPQQVQKQFSIMLEASILAGGENLNGNAHLVLTANPFARPDFQSSPIGLLCRFALRRSGKPFNIDSGNPPIELYQKICQRCANTSPLLVILCLQEVEALLLDKKIDRENMIEFLILILRTREEEAGILNLIKHPEFAELRFYLLYLGLLMFEDNLPVHRNSADCSEEQLMLSIMKLYGRKREHRQSWSTQHSLFITAMVQQLLLKLATTPPGEHTLLQLEILRHPSLKDLWMDESGSLDLRLTSLVQSHLWGPTKALYPSSSLPTPSWAQELCNAILLMTFSFNSPPKISEKGWEILTTALSTLAYCMSARPTLDSQHLTLTSSAGYISWLSNVLQGFKPAMEYPSMAFVISAMLSGPVRFLLGKGLSRVLFSLDSILMEGRGSIELLIASHMLFGLEYSNFIPSDSNELWDTPSFAVIVKNWRGFHPSPLMESDAILIRTMSRIRKGQWAEEALAFLATRKGQLVSSFTSFKSDLMGNIRHIPLTYILLTHILPMKEMFLPFGERAEWTCSLK